MAGSARTQEPFRERHEKFAYAPAILHNDCMKKAYLKIGIAACCYLVADQITKTLAEMYLKTPFHITYWFSLRLEQNVGIAWSIYIPQPWLSVINLILLIVLPVVLAQNVDLRMKESRIFLGMIVGGALGNLADRLTKGYVVDFVSVGWFPVFNLADALLSVGIFLILVFYGKIHRAGT